MGLIFAVARDITDHKQLQALTARQAEELARSNADLEQFASVASHDLQSPLRSVGNLADSELCHFGSPLCSSAARVGKAMALLERGRPPLT